MADYPDNIKSFTNPSSTDKMNVVPHATQHSDANDEINAIETELGTNPKGGYADVKTRLDTVDTSISTLNTSVNTNESDITTLQVSISNVDLSSVATLQASVATNESAISTLNASVNTNETDISTLQTSVNGFSEVVDDTTPQLGGNLDVNGNKIVSTSNGNIDIEPNGTGDVLLGNFTFDADQTVGAGQDDYVLTYDSGTEKISLEASSGGGSASYTESFTSGDLSSGILTVNHALSEQYCVVAVYDNSDNQIIPDEVTATDSNNVTIDVSSFTVAGTWNIRVVP